MTRQLETMCPECGEPLTIPDYPTEAFWRCPNTVCRVIAHYVAGEWVPCTEDEFDTAPLPVAMFDRGFYRWIPKCGREGVG